MLFTQRAPHKAKANVPADVRNIPSRGANLEMVRQSVSKPV